MRREGSRLCLTAKFRDHCFGSFTGLPSRDAESDLRSRTPYDERDFPMTVAVAFAADLAAIPLLPFPQSSDAVLRALKASPAFAAAFYINSSKTPRIPPPGCRCDCRRRRRLGPGQNEARNAGRAGCTSPLRLPRFGASEREGKAYRYLSPAIAPLFAGIAAHHGTLIGPKPTVLVGATPKSAELHPDASLAAGLAPNGRSVRV
ncbi:hypothetical protein BDK51DRAFT_50952 [Blyttiomyces helicus]|uniref:Uncharacterized protein n=1 Tax=Blyttiomyces helicus TaxID=388810 RepID=A0A4V1ISL2_9FUNG|nr:hypothetical protein BDK51DRAFT_50952 [Blyttiomyces helicus]|eukprot:RKO93947.1 hypothetical protein BDK51DRAFT_50952 [Blyttiomyces helicus]